MDTLIFGVVILGLAWWVMTIGQRLADKADSLRNAVGRANRKAKRNHENQ